MQKVGPSDRKLRISIKIRDRGIWHGAPLSLLSCRGQDEVRNEQSEVMFVVCGETLMLVVVGGLKEKYGFSFFFIF